MSDSNFKCECEEAGRVAVQNEWMYDPVTELPFATHKPGECKCTNNLKMYRRRDGSVKRLCSCCFVFGDEPLKSTEASTHFA